MFIINNSNETSEKCSCIKSKPINRFLFRVLIKICKEKCICVQLVQWCFLLVYKNYFSILFPQAQPHFTTFLNFFLLQKSFKSVSIKFIWSVDVYINEYINNYFLYSTLNCFSLIHLQSISLLSWVLRK